MSTRRGCLRHPLSARARHRTTNAPVPECRFDDLNRYALCTQAYSSHLRKPVSLDELRHGLAPLGKTPNARPILAVVFALLDQVLESKALARIHQRPAELVSIVVVFMCDFISFSPAAIGRAAAACGPCAGPRMA